MVPKEIGFNQSVVPACAHATQFAIQSQVNCTERLHVDATIMRYFQTELFSHFLLVGHVNLAAAKLKDGCTVEFIVFRV